MNGLGSISGSGLLLGLWSEKASWEFSGNFMGAAMQSGAGYGLYIVVLAGAMVAAGGLLAWRDIP